MNTDDAARRIRELEESLRKERAQGERYQSALQDVIKMLTPHVSRDLAMVAKLRAEATGPPISEIIHDLERELE